MWLDLLMQKWRLLAAFMHLTDMPDVAHANVGLTYCRRTWMWSTGAHTPERCTHAAMMHT